MTWDPKWGEEDAPVNPDDPSDICSPFGKTLSGRMLGGTCIYEPSWVEDDETYYSFDDLEYLFPLDCEVCGVRIHTYHTAWSAYSWWPNDGQIFGGMWACSEPCAFEAQRRLRTNLRRAWTLYSLMWRECAESIDREHPGIENRHDHIWRLYSPFRAALWTVRGYRGDGQ